MIKTSDWNTVEEFIEAHGGAVAYTGLLDIATRFKKPFSCEMEYSDYDEPRRSLFLDADGHVFEFNDDHSYIVNDLHKITKLIDERNTARQAVELCIEELEVHAKGYQDSPMHEVIRQAKKLIGE